MDPQTFVLGQTYRRRTLHEQYGRQRYGGISTPRNHPFIFLISGESGSQYGYKDGWSDDGVVFHYTGEGRLGDMQFTKGNRAIRDHQQTRKTLHLFEQASKGFITYVGEMVCTNAESVEGRDQKGQHRKAIVFELRRANDGAPSDVRLSPSQDRVPFARQRAFWAFVANPKVYKIADAISNEKDGYWTVKRADVRRGDRVAIWKAKGADKNRGIIAFAEVLSNPEVMSDASGRQNYWVDGNSHGPARRVRINYVLPPAVRSFSTRTGVVTSVSLVRLSGFDE